MNTAIQNNPVPAKRRVSPMRALRQWLFGERALRGPAAIELEVVDRQITREENGVQAATAEALALRDELTAARAERAADLKDGVMDGKEALHLARTLMRCSIDANRHEKTLEALT